MAVPIVQIAEVAVVVTDLDRSVRFYNEVLGMPILGCEAASASLRSGDGLIGLWLPGAWKVPPSDNSQPMALGGGNRQHFNFWIHKNDADAALENLKKHRVKYFGPRYNKKGEMHVDFMDPDGHMLEYWARESFPPPDKEA
ncbi:MAG: VOC family protein [Chloroflexota bacterium]|nr:MAG: VOC family protein [Chloroflexota bacterium]